MWNTYLLYSNLLINNKFPKTINESQNQFKICMIFLKEKTFEILNKATP